MMMISAILIAVAIFVFYERGKNRTRDMDNGDSTLNILNERFARGEISEDEYNNKKNILKHR